MVSLKPKKPTEIPFASWAREKFADMMSEINPCDVDGEIDPVRLNKVIATFSRHYAWLITTQQVETNKLNRLVSDFNSYKRTSYGEAERQLIQEGNKKPTISSIDARLSDMSDGRVDKFEQDIVELTSRSDLLKQFAKMMEKHAALLQTLASNMRSEMYYAGGIPMSRNEPANHDRAKQMMERAMNNKEEQTE